MNSTWFHSMRICLFWGVIGFLIVMLVGHTSAMGQQAIPNNLGSLREGLLRLAERIEKGGTGRHGSVFSPSEQQALRYLENYVTALSREGLAIDARVKVHSGDITRLLTSVQTLQQNTATRLQDIDNRLNNILVYLQEATMNIQSNQTKILERSTTKEKSR